MAPLSDDLSLGDASTPSSNPGLVGMILDGWSHIKDSWRSKEEVEKEAEPVLLEEEEEEEEEEVEIEIILENYEIGMERTGPEPAYGLFHYLYDNWDLSEDDDDDDDDDDWASQQQKEMEEIRKEPPMKMMIEGCIPESVEILENIRVHRVSITGNTNTNTRFIESVLKPVTMATTEQELREALYHAHYQFISLGIFDSILVRLHEADVDDDLPKSFTSIDVTVDVKEGPCDARHFIKVYTKPRGRSWLGGYCLMKKNLLGEGDVFWSDCTWGPHQSELTANVDFRRFNFPRVSARAYVQNQDWEEISSYKERTAGVTLCLILTDHQRIEYGIGWRALTDQSQTASESVRRQLGHHLLSSLKHTFIIGQIHHLPMTAARGCSFVAATTIGGLSPFDWSACFLRHELDFRFAVPFKNAALSMGVSGGVLFPWGNGCLQKPTPLPERFFLGGDSSPLPTLWGVWGFETRGLGPTEPRRHVRDISNGKNSESCGRDFVGGDLAVSAFAHMSFRLPYRWLRKQGAYGHIFANTGNVTKLAENEFRNFSFQGFINGFRTSVGAGIVIPFGDARLQYNLHYVVNQFKHDGGKFGFQFSFSTCRPQVD